MRKGNRTNQTIKRAFLLPGAIYHLHGAPVFVSGAIFVVAAAIFLIPFFYAFGFCFPRGDDFDEATRAMFFLDLPGGIYEIGREWLTWSGRYAYHFLAVFLGKAAESRFLYGAVCASVLFLYFWGFWLVLKNLGGRHALWPASIFLICLLASHGALPNFYLLTDALTSGLQGSAWLIFLGCLLAMRRLPEPKMWKLTLGAGIFAIGIYEHSALAVIVTAFAALSLAFFRQRPHAIKSWPKTLWRQPGIRPFATLFLWLSAFLLLSFLAPGNMRRNLARGIDCQRQWEQLASLCPDWLHIMASFWTTPWPWLTFLAALAACVRLRPCGKKTTISLLLIGSYACFSLAVISLHAMSDAPILSESKLVASLHFYMAIALAGIIIAMFAGRFRSFLALAPALILFFALSFLSANYRLTLTNAANGQMLALARFMDGRHKILGQAAELSRSSLPPTGLWGEILHPGARQRNFDPNLPMIEIAAFPWQVFPVYMKEALATDVKTWPNGWAAWFYGTGSLKAVWPEPPEDCPRIPLALPRPVRDAGVTRAWRAFAPANNSINDWLILETVGAPTGALTIFRASMPETGRLLPMFLQKLRAFTFASEGSFTREPQTALGGIFIPANTSQNIPLGISPPGGPQPPIFANCAGNIYYRLHPAAP